ASRGGSQARDEPAQARDVAAVSAQRVDEGRRDDDPVGAGPRERPNVPWAAYPEPDGHRYGRCRANVADQSADRRRQRGSGASHADERDAVEEAAGPPGDRRAAVAGRRGRDEVDDGEPDRSGDGLERTAFVRREVG